MTEMQTEVFEAEPPAKERPLDRWRRYLAVERGSYDAILKQFGPLELTERKRATVLEMEEFFDKFAALPADLVKRIIREMNRLR